VAIASNALRAASTIVMLVACVAGARSAAAQSDPSAWPDIETKYVFGYTEGATIGLEGEKEVSWETSARFGKMGGHYTATETKLEFEHTPTQFFQFEFGPLLASHDIRNSAGLTDTRQFGFGGLFGELRFLLLGRGPESPIGLTVSVEPNWRRIDETSGARVTNFELETKIAADTELVPNRLYGAVNAIYEPEWTRDDTGAVTKESTLGLTAAVAFRPIEPLLIGAELGYYRHYDGYAFDTYTGDALYIGPTFYLKLTPKMFMTAAWSAQVTGQDVGSAGPFNLAEFSHHRAKVKLAMEF